MGWSWDEYAAIAFVVAYLAWMFYPLAAPAIQNQDFSQYATPETSLAPSPSKPPRNETRLAIDAFAYLNQKRVEHGLSVLAWNDQMFRLAVFRSKDMFERGYYDHVTPEGKCVGDFAEQFGLTNVQVFRTDAELQAATENGMTTFRTIAENLGGTYYDLETGVVVGSYRVIIDDWLKSRGHRFAALYPAYDGAALGCYKYLCAFIGLARSGSAFMCASAEEGLKFWETATRQPEEVPS